MYVQIELSERGKAADSARNSLTKNNKQTNCCGKAVVEPMMCLRYVSYGGMATSRLR